MDSSSFSIYSSLIFQTGYICATSIDSDNSLFSKKYSFIDSNSSHVENFFFNAIICSLLYFLIKLSNLLNFCHSFLNLLVKLFFSSFQFLEFILKRVKILDIFKTFVKKPYGNNVLLNFVKNVLLPFPWPLGFEPVIIYSTLGIVIFLHGIHS